MATLSQGIKLTYRKSLATGTVELTNLLEIPDLGGTTESVEITTLNDSAHTYMDGLQNYGDSIDFKFLYESAQFTTLKGLESNSTTWTVRLPDDYVCQFTGTCAVRLDGVGTNAALTYTLSIKPNSTMHWVQE